MHVQCSFVDLAWQAGFFEGEGSVMITTAQDGRRTGHLQAAISNVDLQLLVPFQQYWGGYLKHKRHPLGNRRPAAQWTIDALKAKRFLQAIRPYVVCDRMKRRIDLGLEFQCSKSATRRGAAGSEARAFQETCRLGMRVLNHRGLPS